MPPSRSSTGSRRHLPSVDQILRSEPLLGLRDSVEHAVLITAIRDELDWARKSPSDESLNPNGLGERVKVRVARLLAGIGRPVINATGVLLHTNLGRSPISNRALTALAEAGGYGDLEIDLETGRRASRQRELEVLFRALIPAEAAHVVTNNAAAILLALRACAGRREILISRGQLVEIGDGFRLRDIIRESGVRLIEVGSTNRTSLDDYADAMGPRTAALVYIHASNFVQTGYTGVPSVRDLARLCSERGVLLVTDNGSGPLIDTAKFGVDHEVTPGEMLSAGADLVTFSTDKLMGGPQGGVIAGRADLIDAVRRHPLARAVRPDKILLAMIHRTLLDYACSTASEIPVLARLAASGEELEVRAAALARSLRQDGLPADVIATAVPLGGGSLPASMLPSWAVRIKVKLPNSAAKALRIGNPGVVARVQDDAILIDFRSIFPEQDDALLSTLRQAYGILSRT